MEINGNYEFENWWSTPIVKFHNQNSDEFNKSLAEIILLKEKEIVGKGNPTKVAGLSEGLTAHWMEYNVLNWDYPECRELRKIILAGFKAFIIACKLDKKPGMEIAGISCWANILRPGEGLQVHHHDPSFVSTHYTVKTGLEEGVSLESLDSGETVYFRPGFMDRSHGGEANGMVSPWDDNWIISSKPKPGRMTFFPSYVRHEVRPNLGSAERISIAMDFFIKAQNPMIYFGGPRWYVPEEKDQKKSLEQLVTPIG